MSVLRAADTLAGLTTTNETSFRQSSTQSAEAIGNTYLGSGVILLTGRPRETYSHV